MRSSAIVAAAALSLTACSGGADEDIAAESDVESGGGLDASPSLDNSDAGRSPSDDPDRASAIINGVLGSDEVAQGQWFAKTERGIPQALFGPPQTEANFLVRCEGEDLVFIRSAPIDGEEADMTLMAGGQTRTITARNRQGPLAQTTGSLPADDPFALALADTTEPVAVALEGGPSYRMPASDALRDVVNNCG